MTKVAANHLSRSAFVYIRQSMADQLVYNPETPPSVQARRSGSAARLESGRGRRTMISAAREAASAREREMAADECGFE
jgi:hypothetical protein